jgi:hypothetical protein
MTIAVNWCNSWLTFFKCECPVSTEEKSVWNKICCIFEYLKNLETMVSNKKENIVKSTKEGRLYIKTSDFFKQVKVQKTVDDLLKSDIVKDIEARKKLKLLSH